MLRRGALRLNAECADALVFRIDALPVGAIERQAQVFAGDFPVPIGDKGKIPLLAWKIRTVSEAKTVRRPTTWV